MVLRFPLLCLLLVTAARAEEDPFVAKYRAFFQQEIEGRWAVESVSDIRVLMVRGFQRHDVAEAATWLIEEPLRKDGAADVVRETVRVLSNYKSPDTVDAMARLYAKLPRKDWEARTLLLCAFGAMKGATALGPIGEGLKDKDPRVCAAACRAAGAGRRLQFRGELEKLLKHKHSAVRGAAATALGELGGEDSLPLLFQLFCTDDSRRVRYDAWLALRRLTLDDQRPCDPAAWEDFWKARAAEAEGEGRNPWGTSFPRVNPKTGTPGDFFGIRCSATASASSSTPRATWARPGRSIPPPSGRSRRRSARPPSSTSRRAGAWSASGRSGASPRRRTAWRWRSSSTTRRPPPGRRAGSS